VATIGGGDGVLCGDDRSGADRTSRSAGVLDDLAAWLHVPGSGCRCLRGRRVHLYTHAFFKACLFLGAGSVIHAMSGEQDIRKMGLAKKIRSPRDLRDCDPRNRRPATAGRLLLEDEICGSRSASEPWRCTGLFVVAASTALMNRLLHVPSAVADVLRHTAQGRETAHAHSRGHLGRWPGCL